MADEMMYRQRLLAGIDVAPDYEATPVDEPVLDGAGKQIGTRKVYPFRQFKKGDVLWSPEDLVAKEPARYAAVGAPRAREKMAVRPTGNPAPAATPGPATSAAPPGADVQSENRLKAEAPAAKKATEPRFTSEELKSQTKADLLDLAKQTGVEASSHMTKDEIVDALTGAGEDGE